MLEWLEHRRLLSVVGQPAVSLVAPAYGPSAGGTTVTISGTNLANARVVDFGTAAVASFISDTANQIVLVSPPGTAGIVDVTVTTSRGTSVTSARDEFAYLGATTSYTVTDGGDTPGNAGDVTLSYAIDQAVANDEIATIGFSPSLSGSTITLSTNDTSPANVYGPTALVVDGTVITIDGSGAPGLTISGGGSLRLFAVTGTGSLTLDDVTLSGGLAQGGNGGNSNLFPGAGGGGAGLGGAVYDDGGVFTADGITFTNNSAEGGNGGSIALGGTGNGGGFEGGAGGQGSKGTAGGTGGFGGGGGGGAGVGVSSGSAGNGGFGGVRRGGGGGAGGSNGGRGRARRVRRWQWRRRHAKRRGRRRRRRLGRRHLQ